MTRGRVQQSKAHTQGYQDFDTVFYSFPNSALKHATPRWCIPLRFSPPFVHAIFFVPPSKTPHFINSIACKKAKRKVVIQHVENGFLATVKNEDLCRGSAGGPEYGPVARLDGSGGRSTVLPRLPTTAFTWLRSLPESVRTPPD